MSTAVSPSHLPSPTDLQRPVLTSYAHRKLSAVSLTRSDTMSPSVDTDEGFMPNESEIHVDATGINGVDEVALALDLDARRTSTDLIINSEVPPYASDDIPIDPALRDHDEGDFGDVDCQPTTVMSVLGKKRQAEEELEEEGEEEMVDDAGEGSEGDKLEADDLSESSEKKADSKETVREMVLGVEAVEEKDEDRKDDLFTSKEDDRPKRAPRKRRKWLKKGEVDPDDPIAVARQQAKHKLIDDAIDHLDDQENAVLDETHPQLLWLWQEVERRKIMQLKWIEAREKAAESEFGRMRDHWNSSARFNFHVKLDEIADELVHANRQKIARMYAERTAWRRDPDSLPNLRAGRGGGGWTIFDKNLLSAGEQRLVPFEVDGRLCQRRDITREVLPLSDADAQADVAKMGLNMPPASNRTRSPSPPPRRASPAYGHYTHNRGQPSKHPPQAVPWPQPDRRYQSQAPVLPPQPHTGMWDRPNVMYHNPPPPPPNRSYDTHAAHDYDIRRERERDRLPPPPSMTQFSSRSDAPSRYHFWQGPLDASSSSLGPKSGPPQSMGYYPPYPVATTLPHPQMGGLPPPRL